MKTAKLKVLFDAGPLANGQKTGVGYFTYRLVNALAEADPEGLELVGHYFDFLGRKKAELPKFPNVRYKTSRLIPGKILSLTRRLGFQLPFDFFIRTKGDVALFPNFVSLPLLQSAKKVVVVHDLCFEEHPEYLQPANREFLKRFVPPSAKSVDLVIAVSEATKASLVKHYDLDPKKIMVIPIPPPPASQKAQKLRIAGLPEKFILFVGTLEPRKNYYNLALAYSLLPDNIKRQYGLVLAGGRGWGSEEAIDDIKRMQAGGENIFLSGYISDAVKTYLYQNASLLVQPSHYEGFGMPLLEAMSYGLPVAASDIPVFHEVAGDAAVYFNQEDPESIAATVENTLSNGSIRSGLIKRGAIKLKQYSWPNSARMLGTRLREL